MATARQIKMGAAFVEVFLRDTAFTKGLRAVSGRLKRFGQSVTGLGARLAAGGGAIAAPFLASLKVFSSVGDQLDKMSQRTGFSVEALSELGFAAEQSGADLETVEKGIRGMQRILRGAERGLTTATDALDDIGLSLSSLSGLDPEAQFTAIADALSKQSDDTKRAGLALELFGRAGSGLLPLLSQGASGIEALRKEARELGIVMSTEDATAAAMFTDAMNRVMKTFRFLTVMIGGAVAPSLTSMQKTITSIVKTTTEWVRENREFVVGIAKTAAIVVGAGTALIVLGTSINVLGFAIGGIASAITLVGSIIGSLGAGLAFIVGLVNPVTLAIGGLTAAFLVFSGTGKMAIDGIIATLASLKNRAAAAFGGIADALVAGNISQAVNILTLFIRTEFNRTIVFVVGRFGEFFEAVKETFNTLTTVVSDIWGGITSFIATAWDTVVGFVTDAWMTFSGFFKSATGGIGDNWSDIVGNMFGSWTEFVGGMQRLWTQASANVSRVALQLVATFDRLLTDITGGRLTLGFAQLEADALDILDRETENKLSEIEKRTREKLAKRNAARDEAVSGAQSRLDEAQAELDQAIADAKKARSDLAAGKIGGAGGGGLSDLPEMIGDATRKLTAIGTFSAAGALRLGAPDQRSAMRQREQMIREQREMNRALQKNRLVVQVK